MASGSAWHHSVHCQSYCFWCYGRSVWMRFNSGTIGTSTTTASIWVDLVSRSAFCDFVHSVNCVMLVKIRTFQGPDIYIPSLTGQPEQPWFTVWNFIPMSINSRQRSTKTAAWTICCQKNETPQWQTACATLRLLNTSQPELIHFEILLSPIACDIMISLSLV